ncbi:MAG: hypothetical protein ACRDFX_00440 [Chloroflexota bacterium]
MKVTSTEQELLIEEIRKFVRLLHDSEAREKYETLAGDLRAGEVRDDLLGHLSNVLEIGLQSGRLRAQYGADGEQALAAVFRRTPAGSALSDSARNVSQALSSLEGNIVESIRVSALGPGTYGLAIDTGRCQVNVRLDRAGVRIENVAIGI